MIVYLASPANQQQFHACNDMPVLMSYAVYRTWMNSYLPTASRLLIDSGAFSELNSGRSIDLSAYVEWASSLKWADAWAGLDDISGDWRRSLKNYEAGGFPTMHDTDPEELLPNLIDISQDRGGWLGIGLKPPRNQRGDWLQRILDKVPDEIHVHGWALGAYAHMTRLDSIDSTNWWRDAMALRSRGIPLKWLTYSECLDIVVKRFKRLSRT